VKLSVKALVMFYLKESKKVTSVYNLNPLKACSNKDLLDSFKNIVPFTPRSRLNLNP